MLVYSQIMPKKHDHPDFNNFCNKLWIRRFDKIRRKRKKKYLDAFSLVISVFWARLQASRLVCKFSERQFAD